MSAKKPNISVVPDRFCPVSGLPIIQKPEWKEVIHGKGYSSSVSIIGERIVLEQPCGYSDLEETIKGLDQIDRVINEAIGENESRPASTSPAPRNPALASFAAAMISSSEASNRP